MGTHSINTTFGLLRKVEVDISGNDQHHIGLRRQVDNTSMGVLTELTPHRVDIGSPPK